MTGRLFRSARKNPGDASASLARQRALRDAASDSDAVLRRREGYFEAARRMRDGRHASLIDEALSGGVSRSKAKKRLGSKQVVTGVYDPQSKLSASGVNFPNSGAWGCAEKNALDELNAQRVARGLTEVSEKDVFFSEARSLEPTLA